MSPSRLATILLVGLAWLTFEPAPALGQWERYELGRRLREFEFEWDRVDDPQARVLACRSLKSAVNAFFSFRLNDAGQAICEARFALLSGKPPTEAEVWGESLGIKPEARLIARTREELPITIVPFYPTPARKPDDSKIRLTLGSSTETLIETKLDLLPKTVGLPLKNVAPGDHVLISEFLSGGICRARTSQTISIADRLETRLDLLKTTISRWPLDASHTSVDRESARTQLRLLESLAAKGTLESDFPANRMLADLEAQTSAADRSEPYLGKSRPGQAWVTIVTRAGRRIPTRVFVPESAAAGVPLPIVVALHGAGGSENMFFESYGHGAIVDRCRERGWLLVSPRSPGFGSLPISEIVDELARIYPIDGKRVMLVGHSMGAGQAIAAAWSQPSRYAAIAVLGGGSVTRPAPGLEELPVFVGVGSEDFALKGAKGFVESLKWAKIKTSTFREYPDVEHLSIVGVALPDVFRFFDERGISPRP